MVYFQTGYCNVERNYSSDCTKLPTSSYHSKMVLDFQKKKGGGGGGGLTKMVLWALLRKEMDKGSDNSDNII